jgi:hypothetical protein
MTVAEKTTRIPDLKALWLAILLLKRAQKDYLGNVKSEVRASAMAYLFGRESILPIVCDLLGIDPIAARLKLFQWRIKGRTGDPIFGYLGTRESSERVASNLPLETCNLRSLIRIQ